MAGQARRAGADRLTRRQVDGNRNGMPLSRPYVYGRTGEGERAAEVEASLRSLRARLAGQAPPRFAEPAARRPASVPAGPPKATAPAAGKPAPATAPAPEPAKPKTERRCRKCGYLKTRCSCPESGAR